MIFFCLVHRGLAHHGSHVGVVVLINPHTSNLTAELRSLLIHPAPHKHLVYGGHTLEGCGDWVFHNDTFTLQVNIAKFANFYSKTLIPLVTTLHCNYRVTGQ